MRSVAAAPRAPYALDSTEFALPALAAQAGRAPLGGPREIVLAVFLVARLAADLATHRSLLSQEQRRLRARDSTHWLGSAALPATIRAALARLAEATAEADNPRVGAALESVMAVTANHVDPAARLELARLAQVLAK